MRTGLSLLGLGVLAIVLLSTTVPASAALGEPVNSVRADAQHMRASARVRQASGYEVHEMQVGGATVREYAADGKVFAVAWQGMARPDLRQLLGTYYPKLQQAVAAAKAQRVGRQPVNIEEGELVVQMGGHQRAFVGRAYVRGMMPASVKLEEIR